MSECKTCHNAAERARRAAARERATRLTIAHTAAKLKRARSFDQVARVVAGMAAHFGDTEEFVATWHAEVDAARRRRPGSKVALDTFIALLNMRMYCENHRPQQAQMSLDEAYAVLSRLMKKYGDNATGAA